MGKNKIMNAPLKIFKVEISVIFSCNTWLKILYSMYKELPPERRQHASNPKNMEWIGPPK